MRSCIVNRLPLLHPHDILIDSFLLDRVGISPDFLSKQLCIDLRDNLIRLFGDEEFHAASIGSARDAIEDKTQRTDMIYWLDRAHLDIYENTFFNLMDQFVAYLNSTCYTGITGYEFHYARYDVGSFYKKHLDQFRNNNSRKYSMIMYLNADWQLADGGELCVHQHGGIQRISPDSGKGVFFESSEIVHEVMLTHKVRMSITGWLKVGL
jgi:SM-20-related protein